MAAVPPFEEREWRLCPLEPNDRAQSGGLSGGSAPLEPCATLGAAALPPPHAASVR